ncbi:Ribosome maturation factor RimM [subsurface metagenome]
MKLPDFVAVGNILAPWGNQGRLKVRVVTDFPKRFSPGSKIYVKRKPMVITGTSWHQGKAIIKLESINSLADAEKLRGELVEIASNQLEPLPEGRYYHFQLLGLEVWTIQGELLGEINEILTTGSNDVYVVKGAKKEVLIPAVSDVVKSIDLDKGRLVIEAIEGLL